LECLSALASITCQTAIFGLTNRRHHHATNSLLETIGAFRYFHIRQPEEEEGWLAAEIWHTASFRCAAKVSRNRGIADVESDDTFWETTARRRAGVEGVTRHLGDS
jgi:hypothetical protein